MSNKWININDKLPEWEKTVLIYKHSLKLSPGMTGKLISIGKDGPFFADGSCSIQGITHWMKLPAPPKEEE